LEVRKGKDCQKKRKNEDSTRSLKEKGGKGGSFKQNEGRRKSQGGYSGKRHAVGQGKAVFSQGEE